MVSGHTEAGLKNTAGSCNTKPSTADVPVMTDPLKSREEYAQELRRIVGEDAFLLRFALLYAVECLGLECIYALVDAVHATANNPDYDQLKRVHALEEERLRPSRLS